MPEVMPTDNDRKHITPLAQKLVDTAQEYARDNGMTLQGVMSSIGTMSGALLARAYRDPAMVEGLAERIGIVAGEFARAMMANDQRELPRKQ